MWKRNIVFFLGGQTISLLGSSMVQFAIFWHITLTTQSGIMLTVAILCGFVPTFILSPFAGVWADRYDRKKLIMLADAGIAAATLLLALLFLAGYDMLWPLLVISAIRAVGTSIQMPAVGAFLPQLVPEDQLMRVNSVNGSIQSFISLVAPMAGAALLTFADMEAIFFIDVATAIIAIYLLLRFVRERPAERRKTEAAGEDGGYFADMFRGFRYVRSNRHLVHFFLFCAFFFIAVSPAAFLTPLQVARSFGTEYWRLTAIEVGFSTGMIAGGALMAAWGGFRNRAVTMACGMALFGLFTIGLGVAPVFSVYIAFMAFAGLTMPVFNIPANVLLQEKVEGEYLGRVFGVMTMISSSMMPLGMLIFGPIADVVAIEWLLIVTGALMLLQGLIMFADRVLISWGRPVEKSSE